MLFFCVQAVFFVPCAYCVIRGIFVCAFSKQFSLNEWQQCVCKCFKIRNISNLLLHSKRFERANQTKWKKKWQNDLQTHPSINSNRCKCLVFQVLTHKNKIPSCNTSDSAFKKKQIFFFIFSATTLKRECAR